MSLILARQGDNKTLSDFRNIFNYCNDLTKIKDKKFSFTFGCLTDDPLSEMIALKKINGKADGRQYTQIIISPTPIGNPITDEQFMEMAKELGEPYYSLGFHCNVTVHFDTEKRHVHIVTNSVSLKDAKKFSQSISQLNRFKLHCNRIFTKYGFDIIKSPTEKLLDNKEYSFSNGYDFLEAYDEIAEDIAFNFYNICEQGNVVCNSDTSNISSDLYSNPDYPRGTFNRFFAAESEIMRDYYNIGSESNCNAINYRNAFAPQSELRPISSFNSADMTPTIIIEEQSAGDNGVVDYFENVSGPHLHIDYSKRYNIYVPDTVDPNDVDSIVDKLPLRTEKEKNDAIRSASAAKAALEQHGDQSQVSLDVSETINIFPAYNNTIRSPEQDIVDVAVDEEEND